MRVVAQQQAVNTFHQVVDVAETPRLAPVAKDGEVLAAQGLTDEGRQYTAVVEAHSWSVGIENPHNAGFKAVVGMVGHRHRLLKALGFVVHAAGTNRVHIAPVVFGLRMHQGVAVNL